YRIGVRNPRTAQRPSLACPVLREAPVAEVVSAPVESSASGGSHIATGVRAHHAPVSRRSARLVNRYWYKRARTSAGGASGNGLWRKSLSVALSASRRRPTSPADHGLRPGRPMVAD